MKKKKVLGIALLAALYVVFPLDVLPDFIPVLGQLDDIFAVLATLLMIAKQVQSQRALAPLPIRTDE